MKSIQKFSLLLMVGTLSTVGYSQKKTQSFVVERVINAPVEKVWQVVGEDFADIAKSHPKLTGSHYVDGTPKNGEGCERICKLSDDGNKYTHEKMIDYNPEAHSFKAEIIEVGGLPLETGMSYMIYKVEKVNEQSCKVTLQMVYRTKPAFMGKLAKGKFRKEIEDYAIAIEHHTLTGEDVNPNNFKEIKKKYK